MGKGRICCGLFFGAIWSLDIEFEFDNVAVLHDVGFAL